MNQTDPESSIIPPPVPPLELSARNPARWLSIFGPGAVIASLTIGAGELIFSSRAGSLFGLNILWFFLLVLFFKWVLVFTIARQMVLTGAHPFEIWTRLPGPRGWLPLTLFILAIACFPVWVYFHSGTLGTFLASLTSTGSNYSGAAHFLWGIFLLMIVGWMSWVGGYAFMEKIQLGVVVLMLAAVVAVLFIIGPDWIGIFKGLFFPRSFSYPEWISAYPELSRRSPLLEIITYVGVLGGSSYDYLAYVSFLREKQWGMASSTKPQTVPAQFDRRWLRAPLIDCTLSFAAVLLFTIVFVVCGHQLLAPEHKIPSGTNLLTFQAAFVTPLYPGLKYLYFAGAFLTIFGTLYGTVEVAPAVLRELSRAFAPDHRYSFSQVRRWSIAWVCIGGLLLLAGSFLYSILNQGKSIPGLVAILTPANLFTGVLGCGIVCLLSPWVDRKVLPPEWRMPLWLKLANILTALVLCALGLYGYWDYSRWTSLLILAGTVGSGFVLSSIFQKRS